MKKKNDEIEKELEVIGQANDTQIIEFATDEGKFYYDFDALNMERVLQAERLFRVEEEMLKSTPSKPSDLDIFVQRKTTMHAFNAILMRKENGKYIDYDAKQPYDIIAKLKGNDFKKLQEVKSDFFLRIGKEQNVLMTGLMPLIELLRPMPAEQFEILVKNIIGLMTGSSSQSMNIETIYTALMNIKV